MVEPASFRSREVCLTEADWTVFAALLVEHLPEARYFCIPKDCGGIDPPELQQGLRLQDVLNCEIWVHFQLDWAPQWRWRDTSWIMCKWPRQPRVCIQYVGKINSVQPNKPEHIYCSKIDFSCRPGNMEDYALARRLFHLLGKVATNRHQKVVDFPNYETVRVSEKGSSFWLGHDAIRWAKEDPKRILCFQSAQWGIRPLDE